MGTQIALTILFLLAFLLLLAFIELVYKRLNLQGEYTRKLAHFSATLSTITFPYLFTDHWYVLALAVIFFVLLLGSRNTSRLRSIHDITRISSGSFLLPAAIYFAFLISHLMEDRFLFILPMLILAISDPIAGLLGMNITRYNHEIILFKHRMGKTWLGSMAFFTSAFIICLIAFYFNKGGFELQTVGLSVIIAIVTATAELLSPKGTDNLVIPMSIILVLILFA
ncbi:MAG: hypothetical protein R6U86_09980 [Bacteroidales bacterium]